jgi:hypothetical protein
VKLAFRVALSLLLTAAFLFLFVRSFDLGAAWRSLRAGIPGLIALGVVANLVSVVVRAWRWRFLMAPIRQGLGMYNLTSTTFIGYMLSFLIPFRLGEVARPVMLARRERVSTTATIATVALERILDAATLMGLLLLFMMSARGAALMESPGLDGADGQAAVLLRRAAWATGLFVLVALPIAVLLVAFPARVVSFLHRLHRGGPEGPVGRAIGVLERFIGGLGVIKRGRDLAFSALLSLATWLVIDLYAYLVVRAFGLPLRFTDMFLLMVPLAIGIAVPTPGGVGPYEFLCQISLTGFWEVEPARAAAVALTLHAVVLVPVIATGLGCMWRDGLHLADVRKMAAAAPGRGGRAS